jgi:prepilin-type N-terminal cleavage/methylation domain-containing protein
LTRRRTRFSRLGFTLLELLVALAVAGIVVLLAHRLFAAATDSGRRLMAARTALDRTANARRWLQAAFLSLDVGQLAGDGFDGRPDHLRFTTWLETTGGWFERRRVELALSGGRFVGSVGDHGDRVVLADAVTDVAFDYLLEPGAATKWVAEWVSPVSAPLAVRLRIARRPGAEAGHPAVDTLLLLIKVRG